MHVADSSRRDRAIDSRQFYIHDDYIRLGVLAELDRLLAAGYLPQKLKFGICLNEKLQTRTDHWVVFNEKYPYSRLGNHLHGAPLCKFPGFGAKERRAPH